MTSTTVIRPCAGKPAHVGQLLRRWRERRRLSQLDLALRTGVSARHLSFIETGRSRPTSEMILRLAGHLDVPLRERNMLLLSGGYAPAYPANGLADPPMSAVHEAIEHVLRAHEPFPAVVIDARWELVAGNDAVSVLTEGAAPALLEPRAADPALISLRDEVAAYPSPRPASLPDRRAILVPLRLRVRGAVLSLLSTTTVFGTPRDITLSELAIESFYPADALTAAFLRRPHPAPRDLG